MLRLAAVLATCVAAGSCLEPAEPTPVSPLVSISPVSPFTRGFDSRPISRFEINIRFQNNGTRTLYIDGNYLRIEKLVDQKWEIARETPPAAFQASRAAGSGQRVTISYVVIYNRTTSAELALLERLRGLYRFHFRLAHDSSGTDQLPPEDSYSQPFAVAD